MKRQSIVGWAVAFLLLSAGAAQGQSRFAVNRRNISLIGGKSMTNWHGQADVQALNFELAHALSPRTEYGVVLSPYNIWQPRSWFGNLYHDGSESVRALSAALLFRRHFGSDDRLVRPYVEISSGPMWATERVPASTSHFNFISSGGAGVTIFPRERFGILVGYRMAHISNAGYSERNPGLNISNFVIGAQFTPMPRR